jgi:hypothetical protein
MKNDPFTRLAQVKAKYKNACERYENDSEAHSGQFVCMNCGRAHNQLSALYVYFGDDEDDMCATHYGCWVCDKKDFWHFGRWHHMDAYIMDTMIDEWQEDGLELTNPTTDFQGNLMRF